MKSLLIVAASLLTLTGAQAGNLPAAKKARDIANTKFGGVTTNYAIRLEGSFADSDLTPRQWDVTFFDAKRNNNGTVVRVRDGAAVSVGGAVRLVDDARFSNFLRNFTGYEAAEILNLSKWKLDSDDALAKVKTLAGEKIRVTDVKMTLEKLSDGEVAPVWSIRVKARSKVQPGQEVWIGSVQLSAESGEVLKNELQPDRLAK